MRKLFKKHGLAFVNPTNSQGFVFSSITRSFPDPIRALRLKSVGIYALIVPLDVWPSLSGFWICCLVLEPTCSTALRTLLVSQPGLELLPLHSALFTCTATLVGFKAIGMKVPLKTAGQRTATSAAKISLIFGRRRLEYSSHGEKKPNLESHNLYCLKITSNPLSNY